METLETIRTSVQQVEWFTSIDFKDAYFHIPIQEQSKKYMRFHIQGHSFQFKALPFGMSTAPMEFTMIAKGGGELMVIHKGIRIHQYLDNWLVRAKFHQVGPKRVSRPLLRQDSSCYSRQHHSGVIHQQGRRHEVGLSVCPCMEDFNLMFKKTGCSQSRTPSRLAECGNRQTIQTRSDYPNRVVFSSRGFPVNM